MFLETKENFDSWSDFLEESASWKGWNHVLRSLLFECSQANRQMLKYQRPRQDCGLQCFERVVKLDTTQIGGLSLNT